MFATNQSGSFSKSTCKGRSLYIGVAANTGYSSRLAESGRLVRRMNHRVDPAAIAEEARTVRLDAVLGPPRRSVPVGDSSTPESRTLTPLIMDPGYYFQMCENPRHSRLPRNKPGKRRGVVTATKKSARR